jgi:serine/threonine-protein kinase
MPQHLKNSWLVTAAALVLVTSCFRPGASGLNSGGSSGSVFASGASGASSSTSSGSTSSSSSSGTGSSSPDTSSAAHWFASSVFFNQSIRNAPLDSQSAAIISALNNLGWGTGKFQIDFSIDVHYTSDPTTVLPFQDTGVYTPDSNPIPTHVPVPSSGASGFESSLGTACDGGDCHYLVMDVAAAVLTEIFKANVSGGYIQSNGSVAIWDTKKTMPPNLRGDVCSSADAGGLPIAPLLFTAEEVAAGTIDHAIRFIIPNNRIQCRQYVRPASHGTGPTSCSGWATTTGVPYGARLRLKSGYATNGLSAGAKVVAAALEEYGMILADGGNIALTAKSDQYSTTKWTTLGSTDLSVLKVTDFEMVDGSQRYNFTSYNCTRTNY